MNVINKSSLFTQTVILTHPALHYHQNPSAGRGLLRIMWLYTSACASGEGRGGFVPPSPLLFSSLCSVFLALLLALFLSRVTKDLKCELCNN